MKSKLFMEKFFQFYGEQVNMRQSTGPPIGYKAQSNDKSCPPGKCQVSSKVYIERVFAWQTAVRT